jgi:endoglucanase
MLAFRLILPFECIRMKKGLNLGGWFSHFRYDQAAPDYQSRLFKHLKKFINQTDFRKIRRWGFDHVRLPLDWWNFFEPSTCRPMSRSFALLDKAIDWAAHQNLCVILNLHRLTQEGFAGQPWQNDQSLKSFKLIWEALSMRYAGRSSVIFELLNEPNTPRDSDWNNFLRKAATLVHSFAPRTTLMVGSNFYHSPRKFDALEPLPDPNVIYTFHFYAPLVFTHQQASWAEKDFSLQDMERYPSVYSHKPILADGCDNNGPWDRHRLYQELKNVLAFRNKHGVIIHCGEFGVHLRAPSSSRARWISDVVDILDECRIARTYWNYRDCRFGLTLLAERKEFRKLRTFSNLRRLDEKTLALLQRSMA